MKAVFLYAVLTFLLFAFIQWTKPAGTKEDVNAVENAEEPSAEEVRKKTSGYLLSSVNLDKYKNMKSELGQFYSDDFTVCQINVKQCENKLNSVENYVQRFVSLFLIISHLQDYEINDPNEQITMDLEISLTGEELAYLQGYSKSLKNSNFPKSFSKLNSILSKIAKFKEKSYKEKLLRSLLSYLFSIDYYIVFSNPRFYRVFSFLTILTVSWIFRQYLFRRSVFTFIFMILNSTILWEGLVLYWKKIKETDIKLYVETARMKNLAGECSPENYRWYHSVINLIWSDKCLHYHQTVAKNAEEEVSLLSCILDTYAFYYVRMPVKLSGSSIRDFTEEISGEWTPLLPTLQFLAEIIIPNSCAFIIPASMPWLYKPIVYIPLSILFTVMAALFFLILCGKRLRLSFFGAGVEIGDVKPQLKNESSERSKPMKKLKPWTKGRFLKNRIEDCGKRWKLTASKSTTEVPQEEVSNSIGSSGIVNSTEVKHD